MDLRLESQRGTRVFTRGTNRETHFLGPVTVKHNGRHLCASGSFAFEVDFQLWPGRTNGAKVQEDRRGQFVRVRRGPRGTFPVKVRIPKQG